MSATPIPHLYRSLLRELRLASHKSRTSRNPTVNTHIRTLVESSLRDPHALSKILLETRDFLRATRIHADLLKRYNPTHGMSQEERVVATARRVGLNAPKEYEGKE
ncbi:hypothetical protein CNE00370 [Cryptococcus deneoformans JEC21]|uniref:N-terminal Ras-GEF domain-containing protein n=1 Tax=Cryptococcus deneoformans (strain JEC21 / ATCC MYA-565) TaxID=214684 RepID=Q5KHE3_CRYD1|nr:hypothetical protein CNE00370 [Cryptococcus neoformans var. neoformans JEC21]AAW43430.2 hypothetical protein CNE00370 [Cryptococcus neoformans var. neoformans JEC21]